MRREVCTASWSITRPEVNGIETPKSLQVILPISVVGLGRILFHYNHVLHQFILQLPEAGSLEHRKINLGTPIQIGLVSSLFRIMKENLLGTLGVIWFCPLNFAYQVFVFGK